MKMNNLSLIASADNKWGIGRDGQLLFSIKRDMAQFRELTIGNIVIMGRKTLDSLPDGNALPNRVNIVLTRDKNFKRDNVIVCNSVEELEDAVKNHPQKQAFVIGGGEIYKLLLPYCSTAYITRVNMVKPADAHMANLDESTDWVLAEQSGEFIENDIPFTFCIYKRI